MIFQQKSSNVTITINVFIQNIISNKFDLNWSTMFSYKSIIFQLLTVAETYSGKKYYCTGPWLVNFRL
jgi:hypothetical protein